MLAFLNHGLKGEKEIRFDQITAVQFKAAGSVVNGYMQVSFMGGHEAKGGIFEGAGDENTVVFSSEQETDFRRLRRALDERIAAARSVSLPSPSSIATPVRQTPYDEIERLGALRSRGLITDEEFKAKKHKLLGLDEP